MDMALVIPKCSCVCGSFPPGEFGKEIWPFQSNLLLNSREGKMILKHKSI